MEICQDAREEAKEWPLLEIYRLVLMCSGEDENDDGEDFGQVMHLDRNRVHRRRVAIVLDHQDDKSGEGVHWL